MFLYKSSTGLHLRTNACNPAYTGVPYRGIGKYSDCLLLLSLRCCTSPHLHRHRPLMCGTGRLSAESHSFWPFALPGCSKSHICHLIDNSSMCRDSHLLLVYCIISDLKEHLERYVIHRLRWTQNKEKSHVPNIIFDT